MFAIVNDKFIIVKKYTTEEFIEKAIKVHGIKYDYSKVSYEGANKKICLICKKHGEFYQEAYSHLRGCGCKECGNIGHPAIKHEDFLKRANIKFNNKFDYSKSVFKVGTDLITIVCPTHGEFKQSPSQHLQTKYGCPKCGSIQQGQGKSLGREEFIERSKKLHDNKYIYEKVIYKTRRDKVIITCPIHGDFITTPEVHLKGCNCPICSSSGWDKHSWIQICKNNKSSKPCVYIIECYNDKERFFKIGRTMRSIKDRFLRPSVMPYNYKLIKQFFGNPDEVFNLEIKLHRLNKKFKYFPEIQFPGSTECFSKFSL